MSSEELHPETRPDADGAGDAGRQTRRWMHCGGPALEAISTGKHPNRSPCCILSLG
jgi:hypothetical protein